MEATAGRQLVLIGLRGSGKTAVGQRAAELLARPFLDTDGMVEQAAGMCITDIFEQRGESGFRDLECAALQAALQARPAAVISAGGGVVLRAENRALLRQRGRCAWLTAASEVLLQRIEQDERSRRQRPALSDLEPAAELQRLAGQRDALYAELAAIRIDTSALTVEQAAAEVAGWVRAAEREGRA